LEFDSSALEDLAWWVRQDRKKALKILRLVQETASDPFGGIGNRNRSSTNWPDAGPNGLMMSTALSIKSVTTEFACLPVGTAIELRSATPTKC
jgi:hypothetical protein